MVPESEMTGPRQDLPMGRWWPRHYTPDGQVAPRAWCARGPDGASALIKPGALHPDLYALGHPNLARVLEGGASWHALAWIDGATVAGPVAPAAALALMDGLLAGLEALHARGLVHRDIKCSNVLLSCGVPVIADFGLVCRAGQCAVQGTPASTPPEQWRGSVDARADLFAAGVVLYRLLAGTHPFPGTPFEAMAAILAGRWRRLQGWEAELEAALAPECSRRVSDATAFRAMLAARKEAPARMPAASRQ